MENIDPLRTPEPQEPTRGPPQPSSKLFSPQAPPKQPMDLAGFGSERLSATVSFKRTRAEIATPMKPGSLEARMHEQMEYISTPTRAPSSSKRIMRSESPTNLSGSAQMKLLADTESLSMSVSDTPPPKFILPEDVQPTQGVSSNSFLDALEMDVDVDVDVAEYRNLDEEGGIDDPVIDRVADSAFVGGARDNGASAGAVADNGAGETEAGCGGGANSVPGSLLPDAQLDNDSEIEFSATADSELLPGSVDSAPPQLSASPFPESAPTETEPAPTEPEPEPEPEQAPISEPEAIPEPAEQAVKKEKEAAVEAEAEAEATTPTTELATVEIKSESEPQPEPSDYEMSPIKVLTPAKVASVEEPQAVLGIQTGPAAPVEDAADMSMDLMSFDRPELTSAKILSDPELMHAASIPLPGTPSNQAEQVTPKRSASKQPADAADFYIPTDWLMNPGTKSVRSSIPESPLKRYSTSNNNDGDGDGDSLIPMTPVNQRLLDSLEIQWVSPRRVPKFSEVEMDEERQKYEERLAQRDELHRMIMESVKEEFATKMREIEQKAEQELRRARDLHKQQIQQMQRDFEAKLTLERKKHSEDIARRDEDTRIQVAELSREIENGLSERMTLLEERDSRQTTLDQLLSVTTAMEEEKNAHIQGLEQELGSLAVERRRLTQQLNEAVSTAEELSMERDEALKRAEDILAENLRLEDLANNLRADVVVAEERSNKIKEYAETTLAGANTEIANMHEKLRAAHHENTVLRTQANKAESRSKSLQIQLDSAKRQNEELLALCERM
ncbi:hypothetical protein GGI07_004872 [Coemansia sp. Benny D115]|nr:hypothetical protein GGI07_004872 [Coemansia sp. Benny D115]